MSNPDPFKMFQWFPVQMHLLNTVGPVGSSTTRRLVRRLLSQQQHEGFRKSHHLLCLDSPSLLNCDNYCSNPFFAKKYSRLIWFGDMSLGD